MLSMTLISVLCVRIVYGLFENEAYVNILSGDISKQEIVRNEHILILFYTDRCNQCKVFAPIFSLVAKIISDLRPDIYIAGLNGFENMQIFRDYDISGLPSVKLFIRKKQFEYTGERMVLPLVRWIVDTIDDGMVIIHRSEYLKDALEADTYTVIGFFKNTSSGECKVFQETVKAFESLSWAIVTDKDLFKEYGVKTNWHIIMFRQFDEPRIDWKGNFTSDKLKDFMLTYSIPYLTEFYDQISKMPDAFNVNIPNYLIGLIDSTQKKFALHKMIFQKAAKNFIGKVKFIYAKVDHHASHYLLGVLKLKKENVPTYSFMKLYPDYKTTIYRPADPKMTSKRVVDFVQNVLAGNNAPHFMSEKLHQRWNKYPVKVLVGDNYEEVTKDKNLSVFVQLCSNKCNQCVNMRHLWYNLAIFYTNQTDLWIATMDMDKNDVRDMRIEKFPTFYLYPKGSSAAIEYKGNRTMDHFQAFLESNGTVLPTINHNRVEDELVKRVPPYITSNKVHDRMLVEDVWLISEEM